MARFSGLALNDSPDHVDMTDYLPHLQWIDGQESRMIDLLTRWANVNSGTQNLPGLNEVLTLLEEEFGKLGGENERITLEPQQLEDSAGTAVQVPLGRALLIRKRPTAPFRFSCVATWILCTPWIILFKRAFASTIKFSGDPALRMRKAVLW